MERNGTDKNGTPKIKRSAKQPRTAGNAKNSTCQTDYSEFLERLNIMRSEVRENMERINSFDAVLERLNANIKKLDSGGTDKIRTAMERINQLTNDK